MRLRLAAELAMALTHLHSCGVLHCDVKLSNVMLTAGEVPHAKLCDFGLSIELEEHEDTYGVRGTPRYMAPEVAFRAFSFPADVYSYGICLYELLHAKRFLAELTRSHDLLLCALNGGRPQAELPASARAALSATDGRFADAAGTLVAECWNQQWEDRPAMVDVTMRLLLRREKELGEAEWSALSAYTTTTATPDSGRSSAPSTSPSTANDRRDEELHDAPRSAVAAAARPSEVAIEMPPVS